MATRFWVCIGSNYYKKVAARTIGILHPGEMGVAVAATLRNSGHDACWASEGRSSETCRRAASAGLTDAGTVAAICRHCEAIVSVCPPEFAEAMAREISGHGFQGLYIDANAISPEKASRIARMMEAGGVRFVDGSIIGLPARRRGETWIYLSGRHAPEAAAWFSGGPLEVEVLEGEMGKASALKMVFAAHTKGLAALRAAVLAASTLEKAPLGNASAAIFAIFTSGGFTITPTLSGRVATTRSFWVVASCLVLPPRELIW